VFFDALVEACSFVKIDFSKIEFAQESRIVHVRQHRVNITC
jgi:hypothetical protein